MRVYHFMSEEHALMALEKQRLKVATFDDLNDPFELLSSNLSDKKLRQLFHAWKRSLTRTHGLLCFSRIWRNPLLWSHYGDRHRGIALQVEVSDDVAIPVNYRKTRLSVDRERLFNEGGFSLELAEKLAITKSSHWSYEEETRVPILLSDCERHNGLLFEKLSDNVQISGVVCGALSTISNAKVARSLPKNVSIEVRRTRLAFRSFDIVSDQRKKKRIVASTN